MAAPGRTAGSMDRRDRATAHPEGGTAGSQQCSTLAPLAFEPRIHTPAAWLDRPVALRRRMPARFEDSVAAQVIPRLRLAHSLPVAALPEGPSPAPEDVAALSHMLMAHDNGAAHAYVETLRLGGVALDRLYLDLLAPSARQLGQFWADDICDFATVTLALGQLRGMLRDHAPQFLPESRALVAGHSVLLAPVPGEQHTFGLDMVADFFRRAGWDAHCAPIRSVDELTSLLRRQSFAIVGLSVGSGGRMETLAATIRAIRRTSRNRSIGVMVGGPVFIEHPEYVALVGADVTALDARQAPVQAGRLVSLLARHD